MGPLQAPRRARESPTEASAPAEPDSDPDPDQDQGPPTDAADEQLADLLDQCLRAERALPGSSAALMQTAPEQLRAELEQLLALGQALRLRSDARARIMTRIQNTAPSS